MKIALLPRDSRVFLGENVALYTIPAGWNSVTVGTPIDDPDNGLASSPSAVSGLICVWGNYSGLSSVTVQDDLAYSFTETIAGTGGTFDYYFIDPATGDIGATGTITIPEVEAVPLAPSMPVGGSVAVNENATAVGTYAATEGDSPITYTLGGADSALFSIDSATGQVSFLAAPDFESPADGDGGNDYELTVIATNATGSDSQAITVTVQNVVESSTPNAFDFTDITVATVGSVQTSNVITVSGIDTSVSITVTGCEYSIDGGAYTTVSGSVNNGDFVQLRLTASAGYGVTSTSSVSIGGVVDSWSVTTEAEDEAPVITLVGGTISLAVGTAYSEPGFSAIDDIDGDITGSVVVSGTVDFDTVGSYTLTYSVTDSQGNTATPVQRVINVYLSNAAPVVDPITVIVPEKTRPGDVIATASAGDENGDSISYFIDTDDFIIDSVTGEIILNTSLNYDETTQYVFNVTVIDGMLQSTALVTVNISEATIPGPSIDALVGRISVFPASEERYSTGTVYRDNTNIIAIRGLKYAISREYVAGATVVAALFNGETQIGYDISAASFGSGVYYATIPHTANLDGIDEITVRITATSGGSVGLWTQTVTVSERAA